MNTNTERNVHLVEAKLNDDYSSLSLVYEYEMKDGIHRREYPRIPIYIYKDKLPVISERNLDSYFDNYTYSYKYSYKLMLVMVTKYRIQMDHVYLKTN